MPVRAGIFFGAVMQDEKYILIRYSKYVLDAFRTYVLYDNYGRWFRKQSRDNLDIYADMLILERLTECLISEVYNIMLDNNEKTNTLSLGKLLKRFENAGVKTDRTELGAFYEKYDKSLESIKIIRNKYCAHNDFAASMETLERVDEAAHAIQEGFYEDMFYMLFDLLDHTTELNGYPSLDVRILADENKSAIETSLESRGMDFY